MLSNAAMTDNPFQLVFRIAQLETELRFAQEKLIQEQGVNHYLLQQLASTASLSSLPAQLRTEPHEGRLETSRNSAPPARPSQFREIVQDSESSADSGVISISANTSDGAELHGSKEGQARVVESQHPHDSKATLQHAPHITTSSVKAVDQSSQHHERKDSATDIGPVQGFARPDARDKQDSRTPYLGSRVHFGYHRLLGAACFVEDMDADGKAVHWRNFARNFPHASAAQWESYYESDVRPVYLEKQRAREQTVPLPAPTELDNRGQALSTDARELTKNERTGSTTQCPQDRKVDTSSPEITLDVKIEEPIPNLIDFDDVDDKVDSQIQPVVDTGVKPPPTPSSTQAPPSPTQAPPSSTQAPPSPTQAPSSSTQAPSSSTHAPLASANAPLSSTQASPPTGPRWTPPPLDVDQLLYQPSTHIQYPYRTAIMTNIPPGLTTNAALTNLERSGVISATHLRTSGMRLKNGVVETDTIMIIFSSGERLRELIEQCEGEWPITSPEQSDCGTATIRIVKTATHPGLLAAKRSERPFRQVYRVVERHAY